MARGRNCYDCVHFTFDGSKCKKTGAMIDNNFNGQLTAKNCRFYET
ncbi:hypothetical protein JXA85_00650 [Candidatus Woesearchaeota archaeon]|nr:hypothetical protein [Candidatus Woesearchaeota archaeon]